MRYKFKSGDLVRDKEKNYGIVKDIIFLFPYWVARVYWLEGSVMRKCFYAEKLDNLELMDKR